MAKKTWINSIPKAGRFILTTTLSFILGIIALIAGLAYIDGLQKEDEKSSSLIYEAFQAISGNSSECVFNGNERMNILCLGIDYNRDSKGMAYTKGARSDTMFVVSIDPEGKTLNIVSIPRDCYVYLGDEYGYDKINAAYMIGGIDLSRKVVSDFLGIPIHHYIIIKVSGASQLVDALGGLVLDVEKDMDYDDNWGNLHIHLRAGEQLLRGEDAVGYARFRMDAESDRGRIRRQQQIMGALMKRIKDPMVAFRLQGIVKVIKQNVDTDMSLVDMIDLAYLYKDFDRKSMKTGVIVGDDSDINGASCIIPYGPANERIVRELLKDPTRLTRGDVTIEVLNGSSEEGLGGKVADFLTQEGFKVIRVGNADSLSDVTTIVDRIDSVVIRNCLENLLVGCYYELGKQQDVGQSAKDLPAEKAPADITIIVGEDRVQRMREREEHKSSSINTYTPPPAPVAEEPVYKEPEPEPEYNQSNYPTADGGTYGHFGEPQTSTSPVVEEEVPASSVPEGNVEEQPSTPITSAEEIPQPVNEVHEEPIPMPEEAPAEEAQEDIPVPEHVEVQ
ncbi:LCP family protein [bacterium]|nr:LCP family protein [bacterium]